MSETHRSPALSGKTALVTGATGGIGGAIAQALAGEGARLGLVARGRERLEASARDLGGWSLPCDVTDATALERLREDFAELAKGPPDILVVAAGVFSMHLIDETPPPNLERTLAVNLRGGFQTVRAFLPSLKHRGSGTIVQIGSVAGRRAYARNGAYSASKFGIRGFHEVLLEELNGTGVRATLLEPAATNTAIWDPIRPEERDDVPDRASMLDPMAVASCVVFVATRGDRVQIPYLAVEAT